MTSRRDFIRDSALTLAVAGTVALPNGAAANATRTQRTVIAESFVFPEWSRAMQLVASGTRGDAAFWSAFNAASRQVQRRIATADDALTLLSLPAPGVEPFAPTQARALAASANDQLALRVRVNRHRYAGLATVAALDPRGAYEAERAVALGLSGITLGANRGLRLDHRSLWPIYEFAASAQVPIYLPTGYAPLAGDAPYRAVGRAGVLAGAATDSGHHALQLIFGGVLDAFPRLTVVLARLGDALPYWYGRLNDTDAGMRTAGANHPQQSVDHYFEHNLLLTSADMSLPTVSMCSRLLPPGRLLATPHESFNSARVSVDHAAAYHTGSLTRVRTVT